MDYLIKQWKQQAPQDVVLYLTRMTYKDVELCALIKGSAE